MATRRKATETATQPQRAALLPEAPTLLPEPVEPAGAIGDAAGPETTGRFIVVFRDGASEESAQAVRSTLNQAAGLRHLAASSDYESGAVSADDLANAEAVHFRRLGIVVVSGEDAVQGLAAAAAADADSPILAIEPEYIAYPSGLSGDGLPLEYLRGYQDAVNHLCERLAARGGTDAPPELGEVLATFGDNAQFTWGLQATRASTSRRSGRGIRVAVLDTGFDSTHPDFRGRAIVSQSFISGVSVEDVHGHGTHCIGTACGPQRPATGVRRYGVAFGAQIFVGKVFNNAPRPQAPTGSVIAAVEWAVTSGCRVASLSLGVPINQKIVQYEVPLQRALNAGTLVVAAAGNNANRPGLPDFDPSRPATQGFVEAPANSDAAIAVAAVDRSLRIAAFSARSSQATGVGGIVNVAGPGVAVFSSVPVARGRHAAFNGTSMATPHVAGIAALWAEATGESGPALWSRLLQTAQPLSLASADVGAGLVQAPQ